VGLADLAHGGEPLPDPRRVEQGIGQPPPEPAPPHGRHRLVEDVEEGPLLRAPLGRGEELEVALRRLVEDEKALRAVGRDLVDVPEALLLGLPDVAQDRSGGGDQGGVALRLEPRDRLGADVLAQDRQGGPVLEPVPGEAVDHAALELARQDRLQQRVPGPLLQDDLPEPVADHLVEKGCAVAHLRGPELARRDVEEDKPERLAP